MFIIESVASGGALSWLRASWNSRLDYMSEELEDWQK